MSMMFIVAWYLPWCRYLAALEGVEPQMYADNLKCVSRDPGVLLRTARFTTLYVRLVGQEPAPSKCVLMSTSRAVRSDMRRWVVTDEGDRWSVKLDVRDLAGHLDSTFRGWSATLTTRVRLVIARPVLIFALPLDFHGRLRVIRSMFIPGAVHGIEASFLAETSLRKLRAAIVRVVWSRRQSLANTGAVLSLLDGPSGCDPAFCVVWLRFSMLRRYLAYRPGEVFRIYRLLEHAADGCPGHGPAHLLTESAAEIGFVWSPDVVGWVREGLLVLSNLAGPIQHSGVAVLEGWRGKVSADTCARKCFLCGHLLDVHGSWQLLDSDHVLRETRLCSEVSLLAVSGMVLCFRRLRVSVSLVGSVGGTDSDGHLFFGSVLFHLWLRFVNTLSFMISWRWISRLGLGVCFGMVGCLFFLVNGGSPWARSLREGAANLLECALGRYSSDALAEATFGWFWCCSFW